MAEVDAGLALRLCLREALLHEVSRVGVQVELKFFFDIVVGLVGTEDSADIDPNLGLAPGEEYGDEAHTDSGSV